jgi:hypothetical protein
VPEQQQRHGLADSVNAEDNRFSIFFEQIFKDVNCVMGGEEDQSLLGRNLGVVLVRGAVKAFLIAWNAIQRESCFHLKYPHDFVIILFSDYVLIN